MKQLIKLSRPGAGAMIVRFYSGVQEVERDLQQICESRYDTGIARGRTTSFGIKLARRPGQSGRARRS